jgi:hypothetical protein
MPAKAGIQTSFVALVPRFRGDERSRLKRYTSNGSFSPSGSGSSNAFSVTDTSP